MMRPMSKCVRAVATTAAALALTSVSLGATCDETVADPATGNIDRLADAVLVTAAANTFPREAYVVLANPDLEQLRVFNAKNRVFERGPNVFFPLSVRTGPATLRLATPVGRNGEVYYLDSSQARVQLVQVTTGDDNFKSVGEGILTGPSPVDLAAAANADGTTRVFVALSSGVVEVYDIDPTDGSGTEVASIALASGALPTAIEIDPTGLTAVVTDGALASVSILNVAPPALDRTLNVGGPSSNLSIGRVDPGDGLAPVALVMRKDENRVAALRLFRPGYREPAAELIGVVELPDIPRVGYVPDQTLDPVANPRVCCPLVVGNDAPTFAWGAVVTDFGELFYVRFDAPRDAEAAGSTRGLFRLMDFFTSAPEVTPPFWSGVEATEPLLDSEPIDNFGTPSFVPYLPAGGIQLTLAWEGRVLSARVADYIDDGEIDVGNTGADIRVGDRLIVDVSEREGPCPDPFEREILGIRNGAIVDIGPLSEADETCLEVGSRLSVDIRAAQAFTAISSDAGDLGRRTFASLAATDDDAQIQTPGFLLTLEQGAELPVRDDVLVIDVVSNSIPLSIVLSQNPTTLSNGFGRGARLPASMVGGAVSVPGAVLGTFVGARRMYLATGAGLLIELNETEVDINSVVSHQ